MSGRGYRVSCTQSSYAEGSETSSSSPASYSCPSDNNNFESDLLQELIDEISFNSNIDEKISSIKRESSQTIELDHQYSRPENELVISSNQDKESAEEEDLVLEDDLKELQELSRQLLEESIQEKFPSKLSPQPLEADSSSSDESGFLSDEFIEPYINDAGSLFTDLFPILS